MLAWIPTRVVEREIGMMGAAESLLDSRREEPIRKVFDDNPLVDHRDIQPDSIR